LRNFFKKIPIVLILCLTFVLMVFVGYGESRRTYNNYRIETIILQSDTFLDIITPFSPGETYRQIQKVRYRQNL